MVYTDSLLDELHDAIFGNGNEPTVNYDEQSINYNENGDTYYWINTYSNREVKSIMVCARIKDDDTNLSGYREIYVDNDDFYAAIDFVADHLDEINMSIDKQMEEKQRKSQREKYHVKDLFCAYCKQETKHIEIRHCDWTDEVMMRAEELHREYYQ